MGLRRQARRSASRLALQAQSREAMAKAVRDFVGLAGAPTKDFTFTTTATTREGVEVEVIVSMHYFPTDPTGIGA